MAVTRDAMPQFPPEEQARAREASERCQLLGDGQGWAHLLYEHVEKQLGPTRARLAGRPDASANLFASVIDQTSTLYDTEPRLTGGTKSQRDAIDAQLEAGCWWGLAPENQRKVGGLLETLVYVGWDRVAATPIFEVVPGYLYFYETAANNANRIVRVWRARVREIPGKPDELAWFWDRWDIDEKSPGPSFTIWTNDRKRDVTDEFESMNRAEWAGEAYPYRENGKAVLPFAVYRLRSGPSRPKYWSRSEVVFGTLQCGLLWTAAVHGMLRASWDQRWIANGTVVGGTTREVKGRNVVLHTPDPTKIMQFKGDNVQAGAWGASVDIEKGERFCRLYEARLAVHLGLSPAELVIESLNPASGATITVSQRGKRVLQHRQRPVFRRGDLALIAVLVAVAGANKVKLDATGIGIRYGGVGLTPEERTQLVGVVKLELELGLLTQNDAWLLLNPEGDEEQAVEALVAVDTERRRRGVVTTTEQRVNATSAPQGAQPPQPDPSPGPKEEGVPKDETHKGKEAQALGATGAAVQDTAFAGVQMEKAFAFIEGAAQKRIPRGSAVNALRVLLRISAEDAEAMVGDAGGTFEPAVSDAPPAAAPEAAPQTE